MPSLSGDATKLPKWAQRDLERLQRDVQTWKQRACTGPEGSNTFIWMGMDELKPLGDSPNIRFQTGSGWRDHIQVRLTDRNELLVMGSDQILITPQAGNVITIQNVIR